MALLIEALLDGAALDRRRYAENGSKIVIGGPRSRH
jgi:hypothetical protein